MASAVLLSVLAAVCLLPVASVIVGSFTRDTALVEASFSLDAWSRALSSTRTARAIGYSFLLSVRVPAALVVALVLSWVLVRVRLPGRTVMMYSLWLAFFMPTLPITLGWVTLLDPHYGLLNKMAGLLPFVDGPVFNIFSIPGILWVHLTLSTIPIMTLLLEPAQRQIDASYEEAATVFGAGLTGVFRRINVPLLMPASITALLAGLIKSLEVFEVEQVLGVPAGIHVYSTRIFDLLRNVPTDIPQARALSTFVLMILFFAAMGYQWVLRRSEGGFTMAGKGVRRGLVSPGRWSYLISGALFLGVAFAIVLPAVVLMVGSFNTVFGFYGVTDPWTGQHWRTVFQSSAFVTAARNSLLVGLGIGVVGTGLYAVLAWILVRKDIPARRALSVLVWLPWAIPGVLLGLAFLQLHLSVPILTGLLGTLMPLAVVLVVQSLPFGMFMLQSAIRQVSPEVEESAYMSGASTLATLRTVTLPMIAPMMVSVFAIVFMSALKDISSTVLLATPGTRTLPLLMFEFATSSRMEAAAVIGVLMTGVGLIVTALAMRLSVRVGV